MRMSPECSNFLILLVAYPFPVPHSRSVSGEFTRFLKIQECPQFVQETKYIIASGSDGFWALTREHELIKLSFCRQMDID